jgi:hypothetical protein
MDKNTRHLKESIDIRCRYHFISLLTKYEVGPGMLSAVETTSPMILIVTKVTQKDYDAVRKHKEEYTCALTPSPMVNNRPSR